MASLEQQLEAASSSGGGQGTDGVKVGEERKESCVPHFDALWFCYTPVHQMRRYYMEGTVDDCTGHWDRLWNCLKTKTTRYKDQATPDPNAANPLWELRTHAEASEFWRQEFGHLSGEGGGSSSGGEGGGSSSGGEGGSSGPAGEPPRHPAKTTLI